MMLSIALGILGVIAAVATVIAGVRDSRGPVPTVWGYDTRRPLP